MKKFREDETIINKQRQERPKVLTNRDKTRVLKAVEQDPYIPIPEIREKVLSQFGKIVSLDTVRCVLNRADLKSRVSRNKSLINAVNRKKRLEFAQNYMYF